MLRKIIICLFAQAMVLGVAGQRNNYKELYESLKIMKDYEAFQALFAYQSATTSKDFVNVNGYYQMGVIAQKMMRQYDPFLQANNVSQCIFDSKTYLSLAGHYLTEKEAKNNAKYYQSVEGGASYDNIKKDIEKRIADITEYEKYFTQNQHYLMQGTLKYNACISFFALINSQNSRLNDLYFLANSELLQNLDALQINFDSTLYYIDKLKASLETYQMNDYKINHSLLPVETYRLHGITAANLIAKEVKLWDFSSWIKGFRAVLDSDVAFLYKQADEVYKTNSDYIAKLKSADKATVTATANYAVSPLIINKINKYDFNAAVSPLLKYQEEKIHFLNHVDNNERNLNYSTANSLTPSVSYYFELSAKKRQTDSALSICVSTATQDAIKKYDNFFTSNFKNFEGYKTSLTKEATDNDAIMHTAIDNYKNIAWNFKNEPLSLNVGTADKKDGSYIIHDITSVGKKALVTGSFIDSQDKSQSAFVATLNEAGETEWVKVLDLQNSKMRGVLIAAADNGFAAVISAETGNGELQNNIYLFDSNGNTKKNAKLSATAVPRKLLYDDIAETWLVAFKGTSFNPCAVSSDALQTQLLRADLTQIWSNRIDFTGYLANIVKINDLYYIYGAYNSLLNTVSNEKMSTGNDGFNAFVCHISTNGATKTFKTFAESFSYYPLYVNKISNEYVDMVSVKASSDGSINRDNSACYMILTEGNEVYYRF
ncbi:MAG: hypothetical protein LBG92_06850 [Prevotellaceae bacterium]|nr:hypothetical protein [Prevotellaceae bacterium]